MHAGLTFSAMLTTKGDPWVRSSEPTSPKIRADDQNPPEKDIITCTQEVSEALRYVRNLVLNYRSALDEIGLISRVLRKRKGSKFV